MDVIREQLEDSTDCRHTYLTYREIDRPGPHPADFADLSKDGGMLAPLSLQEEAAAAQPAPAPKTAATNSPAAKMTGTNQPTLIGTEVDPAADTRKVKYWITMSLPTFWTKPPDDAKASEIYIYRPDYYQDQDGIERRITLWFNPNARTSLKEVLARNIPDGKNPTIPSPGGPKSPAIPATPAGATSHNPFSSPLDENYRSAAENHATNTSSKTFAPSGVAVPDGMAAVPATNAAPTGTK